jgi:hypothetical protein
MGGVNSGRWRNGITQSEATSEVRHKAVGSTAREHRRTTPGRKIKQDYHGRDLSVGDIVEHVLDGGTYRVLRVVKKTDSVMVEPTSGSRRGGFNICPCETLIKRMGE